jgi:hypothetical protein
MTDEKLMDWALHGGETEWEELHKLCLDRDVAERLGRALGPSAIVGVVEAVAWASMLEELHPGLKVTLRPASATPGARREGGKGKIGF